MSEAWSERQPKALVYLFLTEMWERFGFYIVQGLLILYITGYFGYTDKESYTILGVFTALAYISPLIGGYLANKLLGYKQAILSGGFFLIAGYVLLALPYARFLLFPALATIIVGNGLFKPNISSLLGVQYAEDDPKRDSGFTIFYVGINIGASLAGLSAGYIKEYFGWQASFALAAIGLTIGIATFFYGLRHIKNTAAPRPSTLLFKVQFFICCVIAIIGLSFLLKIYALADILLPIVGVILLVLLLTLTLLQNPTYRKRLFLLNILIVTSIVFWMLFLQMFSSANLFVDRLVNKDVFGLHLTTTVFWASEGLFILLLGPFFAMGWQYLHKHNKNPSPILKFSLGLLFAGFGFTVLVISTYFPNDNNLVNPFWVFAAYLCITMGELFLSPIGLSAVTLLAPPSLIGLMMGVWFVATGYGGIFSGMIAELASVPANVVNLDAKLAIYQEAFLTYACIAFSAAIILFFVHLFMRRLLKL